MSSVGNGASAGRASVCWDKEEVGSCLTASDGSCASAMLPRDFLIGRTTWRVLGFSDKAQHALRVLCLQHLPRWPSQGGGEHAGKGQEGGDAACAGGGGKRHLDCGIAVNLPCRGFIETGSPRAGRLSIATGYSEHPQSPDLKPSNKYINKTKAKAKS